MATRRLFASDYVEHVHATIKDEIDAEKSNQQIQHRVEQERDDAKGECQYPSDRLDPPESVVHITLPGDSPEPFEISRGSSPYMKNSSLTRV